MSKIILFLANCFLFLFFAFNSVQASDIPTDTFYKARVITIIEQGSVSSYGFDNPYQIIKVKFLDGSLLNQETVIDHGQGYTLDRNQLVKVGDVVVIVQNTDANGQVFYQVIDKYRLHQVIPLVIFFFLAVILLSKWQGIGSVLGMVFSLGVIIKYIIPQILLGRDPLLVSILGCLVIMVISLYLAHGFSKKTTIALISTFLTLVATGLLATLFVNITHLSGLGTEDAYSLKLGTTAVINLKGLLLGGILIGTLGVLDDVTTSLSASVFEIFKANPKLKFSQLFSSGLSVGREHIASLVNTLVLAYAGASLPIFVVLVLNPSHYPLWFILNDELITEEVIRTLAGSLGLVAAVPLTAFLSSLYLIKQPKKHA